MKPAGITTLRRPSCCVITYQAFEAAGFEPDLPRNEIKGIMHHVFQFTNALTGWALTGWAITGWDLTGWALTGWALTGWASTLSTENKINLSKVSQTCSVLSLGVKTQFQRKLHSITKI